MKQRKDQSLIYDTAISVFARYGFKKTALDDVAALLNMTKSNFYRYVKSKEDLYEKAVSHGLRKWQTKVIESMNDKTDVVAQFKEMSRKAYFYLTEDKELSTIIKNDPSIFPISRKEDRYKEINNDSIGILKYIIKKGIKAKKFRSIKVEKTAEFIFSIYIMFINKTYVKSDNDDGTELFENGLSLILNGLLKK